MDLVWVDIVLFDSYWCLGLGLVAPGFCTGGVISVIGVIVFSVLVVYWLGVYCVMVGACVVVYLLFDTLVTWFSLRFSFNSVVI